MQSSTTIRYATRLFTSAKGRSSGLALMMVGVLAGPVHAAYNVRITVHGTASLDSGILNPTAEDTEISASQIVAALENGIDVTINTGTFGGQAGNIVVDAEISVDGGFDAVQLTLNAANDITVDEAIASSNVPLSVELNANIGGPDDPDPSSGNTDLNALITTRGGEFTCEGEDFNNTGGQVQAGAGRLTIDHRGDVTVGSSLTTSAGAVEIRGEDSLDIGAPITTTADITLTADHLAIQNGATIVSDGALAIVPHTAGTTIGIGGGAGTLTIDDPELGELADGFSSITIGSATSGDVTVHTATFNDPVTIVSGGTISDNSIGTTDITATAVSFQGDTVPGGGAIDSLQVTGDTVLSASGQFRVGIDGESADALVVSGALNLNGASLNIDLLDAPAVGSRKQYTIVTNSGTLTGLFTDTEGINLPNGSEITVDGTELTVTYDTSSGGAVVLTESGGPDQIVASIVVEDGLVKLTWTDVGASHYRVLSGAAPDTALSEDTSGTFVGPTWTAPMNGATRFYRIEVVD